MQYGPEHVSEALTLQPVVSVVIPTYNRSDLLIETLQTVFAQTFRDFEVIVVNDGSTDDTLERLLLFGERVRVISQQNAGIGAARNRGIAEASGRYVALLDHDDLWMPEKLASQVHFLETHPECIAVGVPYAFSTSPSECIFDVAGITNESGVIERPLAVMVTQGHRFLWTSSVLMFDRVRAWGLCFGTERECVEDVQFYLGLFARGQFGIAGRDILAIYRKHSGNFSAQASYYYCGLKLLRHLHRRGELPVATDQEEYLSPWLALQGRQTFFRQIEEGEQLRALLLYLRELPYQVRYRSNGFLWRAPLLFVLPRPIVHLVRFFRRSLWTLRAL
jgi:glycosyltransferase involved in cell wall biosynthesis